MKYLALLGVFALSGCMQSPGEGIADSPSALEGDWSEFFPEPHGWFAGAALDFSFREDSVFIQDHRFTDVVKCIPGPDTTLCSSAAWTETYAGKAAVTDSEANLDIRFLSTDALPLTERPSETQVTTNFKFSLDPATQVVTLVKAGGDVFLDGKTTILLKRKIHP
jgi:hypothetical protein